MKNPAVAPSSRPATSTACAVPALAAVTAPDHPSGRSAPFSHADPADSSVGGFCTAPLDGAERSAPLVAVTSSPSPLALPMSTSPAHSASSLTIVKTDNDEAMPTALPEDGASAAITDDDAVKSVVDKDVNDPRPSMAMLLRQQEAIRRDNVKADTARRRVETPKPLAVDIEAIERQYATGGDWSDIASCIHQSRPYELPRARYDMVIETGTTFTKTSLTKIMAALVGTNHRNRTLDRLYEQKRVGQVSKMPGGNLRLKLKDREACMELERTTVSILGNVYPFKPFDVLASKFFLDISNVDSDTNTDLVLRRLYLLRCEPVYDTYRDVNLATGLTSATWRVYFRSSDCPPPLVVNGSVCDQLVFNNKLYPVHGKDAPFASERLPFGFRSHHSIDLGSLNSSNAEFTRNVHRQTAQPAPKSKSSRTQSKKSHAPQAEPVLSLIDNALENEETKEDGQLQPGAQHGQQIMATQLAKRVIDIDDVLSISTSTGSGSRLSPPASPKASPKPMLMLTNGSDEFITVTNKKKRSRGGIDFTNMLTKQMPKPLDGVATTNYFQALQTLEVKFELIDATRDKKYGIRHHVRPVDVKRPEALKSSKESAFFVEKHHTKIRKASIPSPVVEVTDSMISDENTALLNTLDDRLEDADRKVESISTILRNATNPDHIMKKATESPLAFNSALSLKMAASGNEIEELAQLHMINRVLSANKPNEDTTFVAKWKRLMKTSVPSKRQDIFAACGKWWKATPKIFELTRFTKALSAFELTLMSIAPTLFANDHWIQYVTGHPVEWIPAHHARLLHPNTLLSLLRSKLGELCMVHWREIQWQGHLLDELEELRKLEGHYPTDKSVLQLLVADDGSVTPVAGGIATRC